MKDVISVASTIAAVIIAAFGAAKSVEWTRGNRLRTRLSRDLAVLASMDATSCNGAQMRAHVDREVHLLARTSRDEEILYQARLGHDALSFVLGFILLLAGCAGVSLAGSSLWNAGQPPLSERIKLVAVSAVAIGCGSWMLWIEAMKRIRTRGEEDDKKATI